MAVSGSSYSRCTLFVYVITLTFKSCSCSTVTDAKTARLFGAVAGDLRRVARLMSNGKLKRQQVDNRLELITNFVFSIRLSTW